MQAMLWKIVVILVLLMAVVSAESIILGDYNLSFELNKPHEMEIIPPDIIIKTFDGKIIMEYANWSSSLHLSDNVPTESINFSGRYGDLQILRSIYDVPIYDVTIPMGKNSHILIQSHMPFLNTADFLRSLHIEPVKA